MEGFVYIRISQQPTSHTKHNKEKQQQQQQQQQKSHPFLSVWWWKD